jgi:hypothetical protein
VFSPLHLSYVCGFFSVPHFTKVELVQDELVRPSLTLLSLAVVVSLALGLFQDFGTTLPDGEPPVDWVEGIAILMVAKSVVTGESDAIKKESYTDCLVLKSLNSVHTEGGALGGEQHSKAQHVSTHTLDCFVVSVSRCI